MYNGFLLSIFTRTLSSVFSEAEICGELKFNLNSFLSELIVPLSFVLDPIETFGKSAPYKEIYKYFGLTVENISKKTKNLIKNKKWH